MDSVSVAPSLANGGGITGGGIKGSNFDSNSPSNAAKEAELMVPLESPTVWSHWRRRWRHALGFRHRDVELGGLVIQMSYEDSLGSPRVCCWWLGRLGNLRCSKAATSQSRMDARSKPSKTMVKAL